MKHFHLFFYINTIFFIKIMDKEELDIFKKISLSNIQTLILFYQLAHFIISIILITNFL